MYSLRPVWSGIDMTSSHSLSRWHTTDESLFIYCITYIVYCYVIQTNVKRVNTYVTVIYAQIDLKEVIVYYMHLQPNKIESWIAIASLQSINLVYTPLNPFN